MSIVRISSWRECRWEYRLPYMFFILHGPRFRGEVQAGDKSHARAAVKKLLGLERFPVNGTFVRKD